MRAKGPFVYFYSQAFFYSICNMIVLFWFCCLFACLAGGSGGVAILLGNIQQCVLFDLAFFHIVVNV